MQRHVARAQGGLQIIEVLLHALQHGLEFVVGNAGGHALDAWRQLAPRSARARRMAALAHRAGAGFTCEPRSSSSRALAISLSAIASASMLEAAFADRAAQALDLLASNEPSELTLASTLAAADSSTLALGSGDAACAPLAGALRSAGGGGQVGFVFERTDLHHWLHGVAVRTAVMEWVSDGLAADFSDLAAQAVSAPANPGASGRL